MSAIIILFCLVNFAASLQLNTPDPTIEIIKGGTGQLKWTYSTTSGEIFAVGGLDHILTAPVKVNAIAYFSSVSSNSPDFTITLYSSYSGRSWSATHSRNTKEIVLNVRNVDEKDDGSYIVRLTFRPSNTPLQATIKLNVLVKPYYPPGSFTSSPQTIDEGKELTLKCEPSGTPTPIKIIWEKNNVVYKETDRTDPNLVFTNVTRDAMGDYVCKASNKAGRADTNPSIQLFVKYKPVNTKFTNTSELLVGKYVDLQCSAEADPVATYSISGAGFPAGGVTGSKSGKFSIKVDLTVHDGKIVSCVPSNRLGNGPRVDLKLDVQVPPEILPGFPKDQTMDAIEGRNYSVDCFAKGKPAADMIWLFSGSPLPNQPKTYIIGKLRDNTFQSKSTLTLSPAKRENNGIYTCEAKNRHGSTTGKVTLNLMYLPEVTNTNDFKPREVKVGDDVKLNCITKGNPETTYHVWRWENGTVIQNKTKGELEFVDIEVDEGGRLSCAGGTYIGEGEKRYINLFVRVPPRIIVPPQRRISLNESDTLQLFCNASGVPEPTIHWDRDGAIVRFVGERLHIPNVKYSDKGTYTCTADNGIQPNTSASSIVTIYFRPVIQTTSATDTLLGAESGQIVDLVCIAEANPVAEFKWLSYPTMRELNTSVPDVLSIRQDDDETTITMQVRARFGAKYLCYAYNNRGNDTQIYEIRPKGPPEAPVLDVVHTYIHNVEDQLSSVRARIEWTPGYNGGQSVWYKVHYGAQADRALVSNDIDDQCNCLTITRDLEANKNYVFYVQAHNKDGPSNSSNIVRRKTAAFYGSASAERLDLGKIVKVTFWVYTKANVTKQLRYREKKEDSEWETRNPPDSQEPLIIEDLDPEKHYEFQALWTVKGRVQITDAGEVAPFSSGPDSGGRSDSSLTREEIIAVIAGVGGFLLIVILILFLCLIRRRQKPKRDESVVVMRRQPQNVDIVTRRSLIGSVEDDPFESAHYGTKEKKQKNARDSYYLPDSEDMNTFTADNNTGKRVTPVESSQAYQPYKFGKKSQYSDGDSSDDDSYRYKSGGQKQKLSDDEMSSEPGDARVGNNGKIARDNTDGSRDQPRPNPNDVYAKVSKRDNNNRPTSNGRGAPPPYRPRSTADTPLPPYPDDQLDLDDPAAVPYDDPLPPPMPVISHSVPDGIWNDRYADDPRDSVDTTMERAKSPSRTSLGAKPYINAKGKLVRPGSSSRYSSSENFDDSDQRSPEPEVPPGRSRREDLDSDENNLVSYLV